MLVVFALDPYSSAQCFPRVCDVMSLSVSQIRNEMQKGFHQMEESTSKTLINHEQRVNTMRVDLNLLEEQINQRMTHVSSECTVSLDPLQ